MIDTNYCMGCMKALPDNAAICPHCNYDNNKIQAAPYLKKGSIIFNRYVIGAVKATTTDTITYIGLDSENSETVSIIEFYPERMINRTNESDVISVKVGYEADFRDYLQSFLKLWDGIGKFNGTICLPNVLEIVDFNGTVYAVTRYKDCITLRQYFEKKPPLTWKKASIAFRPVIDAVSKLNKSGIYHGAISPDTVCVGADGKIHITGFSIPECYKGAVELKAAPVYGFAPLESYSQPPVLNEKVDVYSLTALLYYSITGIVPSEALQRAVKDDMVMPSAVAKTLTKKEIEIFVKGLSLRANNRIQNVSRLFELLYNDVRVDAEQKQETVQSSSKTGMSTKSSVKQNKKATESNANDDIKSIIPLMVKTFIAAVVVCTLLFVSLYSTVLYKNIDIPVFNKLLAPISFLPINKSSEEFMEPIENTTVSPVQTTSSSERSYVTVPDFTSKNYELIKSNVTYNKNFKIVFKFEDSKKFEKNTVISQSLIAGESVLSGTEIIIVISSGIRQVELPDVIGMEFQAAKEKLELKGFKVKQILTENDGNQVAGEVYMMNKVAGLEFDEGTEIELSVWDKVQSKVETTNSPE